MTGETKRADAGTPAKNNEQRHTPYPRAMRLSSEIGEILLLLAAGIAGAEVWGTFERLLRDYYGGAGQSALLKEAGL